LVTLLVLFGTLNGNLFRIFHDVVAPFSYKPTEGRVMQASTSKASLSFVSYFLYFS